MSASICCNRHAQDFARYGESCPTCGALLRFRTRYVTPDKRTKARMVGCELQHWQVPEARSMASFYEFSLRDGFKRARLAKVLARKLIREHPIWADTAATDAIFALALCRDEIERDARLQAERRRKQREKKRLGAVAAEQLSGV